MDQFFKVSPFLLLLNFPLDLSLDKFLYFGTKAESILNEVSLALAACTSCLVWLLDNHVERLCMSGVSKLDFK